MNRLLNALEDLYDTIKSVENDEFARRIHSFLIVLLHKDEFNLDHNDPNHPYTRFAARDDGEGNRLRLFQALQEAINEEESDHELQACVDLMFETPDTEAYNKTQTIMRRYMAYADSHRSSSSDSDSD